MAPQDTSRSFPANSYTSSTSHAKSASWTEDALDGWMAENMTSEVRCQGQVRIKELPATPWQGKHVLKGRMNL